MTDAEKEYSAFVMSFFMAKADFELRVGVEPNLVIIGKRKLNEIAQALESKFGSLLFSTSDPQVKLFGIPVKFDTDDVYAFRMAYVSDIKMQIAPEDVHECMDRRSEVTE